MPYYNGTVSDEQMQQLAAAVQKNPQLLRIGKVKDLMQEYSLNQNIDQRIGGIQNQVQNRLNEVSQPGYGLGDFLKLAGAATPTATTFQRLQAAQGGSPVQAQQQFQAAQKQAQQGALDAFSRFNMNKGGEIGGLLGQLSGLSQYSTSEVLQYNAFQQAREDQRKRDKYAFWGGLIGNVAGAFLGGGGAPTQTQNYPTLI